MQVTFLGVQVVDGVFHLPVSEKRTHVCLCTRCCGKLIFVPCQGRQEVASRCTASRTSGGTSLDVAHCGWQVREQEGCHFDVSKNRKTQHGGVVDPGVLSLELWGSCGIHP